MNRWHRILLKIHRTLVPPETHLEWAPYIWLSYLLFLFLRFIFGGYDPVALAVTLGTVVVFLPLYFGGFRCQGFRQVLVVAGMTLLGLIAAPWNRGASVYFVYAGCFAAFTGPPRVALRYIGLVILAAGVETWLLDLGASFLAVTTIVGGMVGIGNIFWRQMEIKNRALRASQEEVQRLAATAERERIARDLHDVLGHTLSTITLKSELAARVATESPERARIEMRDVERISRNALSEVRQAISGYRASTVIGELTRSRTVLATAGIDAQVELPDDFSLPTEYDNLMGLVLREAVTNVVRHSRASTCWISVSQRADMTRLVVEDDGVGAPGHFGSGLRGMRERLEAVDGGLEIGGRRPRGMRLAAEIPHGYRKEGARVRDPEVSVT